MTVHVIYGISKISIGFIGPLSCLLSGVVRLGFNGHSTIPRNTLRYSRLVTWHAYMCLARVRATKPGFSSKFQYKLFTTTAMRLLCDTLYS
jgi:hypothetical protein